jgi:hypothetical protein
MLHSISWRAFITTIAWLVLFYYVVVLYIYYRHDLLLQVKRLFNGQSLVANTDDLFSSTVLTDTPALMSGFADELQAFTTAAGIHCAKSELLFGLRKLLQKFAPLQQPALQPELRTLIISACRDNCAVTLDPTETDVLWNG